MASNPRKVKPNDRISRITPPKNFVKSYSVIGGFSNDLLLGVDELTENEAKYVLCTMLDHLSLVGTAIETGNLQILLKSLENLKPFYKGVINEIAQGDSSASTQNNDANNQKEAIKKEAIRW